MNFFRSRVYSSARSARSGWSGSGSFTKATNAWITATKGKRISGWTLDNKGKAPPTLIRFGGRLPVLGTDDGQAHLALLVDVRVVDPGLEADLWRLEGVLGWEGDFYFEGSLVIRWVLLRDTETERRVRLALKASHQRNASRPVSEIVTHLETSEAVATRALKRMFGMDHKITLTGTINPVHCRIFDSSTTISLNDFSPDARRSVSS